MSRDLVAECPRCQWSFRVDVPRSWSAAAWGAFLAVIPVFSLAWAIFSQSADRAQPDLNDAKGFIANYYRTAPTNPDATWKRLSDRYQKYGPPNGPVTLADYSAYYSQFSEIDATDIGLSRDHDGWFHATVVYHYKDGQISPAHFQFDLICPQYTKYPFRSCTAENLLLDSAIHYPKRYWKD